MKKFPKKNIQFVIFDCDNVLVNSDIIKVSLMLDVLEEHGIEMHPDNAIKKFSGRPISECIGILRKACGGQFDENYHAVLQSAFDQEVSQNLEMLPGVDEFIKRLSCQYFVSSSEDIKILKAKLSLTGLLPFFMDEKILTVSQECYLHEIQKMILKNNLKISRGLLIKDNPQNTGLILESGLSLACPGNFRACAENRGTFYENINELYDSYCFR